MSIDQPGRPVRSSPAPANPLAHRRVLISGFEAFGGESRNPSLELVRALDGEFVGGLQVVGTVLPCSFDRAPALLAAAIARWSPALVLALGQAGGRSELSLERVAINLIDARIPDNDGLQPVDRSVLPGAPVAYFSALPIKAMVAAARAAGVPAAVSHSAGTFVCNQVAYALLHHAAPHRLPAGFMHVPWLPEQVATRPGAPSMALETMLRGLRAALTTAAELLARGDHDLPVSEGRLD